MIAGNGTHRRDCDHRWRDRWPQHRLSYGRLVAAGFSGHGFMHAPAIAKLMAELILDGRASTIDISALSLDRFRTGRVFPERAVF